MRGGGRRNGWHADAERKKKAVQSQRRVASQNIAREYHVRDRGEGVEVLSVRKRQRIGTRKSAAKGGDKRQ